MGASVESGPRGRVLVVAGSDSGGGAGIQADIKAVTCLGGFAMTAVTAITVQNTRGVFGVHPVPLETVVAQIDVVASDLGVDAVKTGMLGTAEIVEAVAQALEAHVSRAPRVIDPVMIAKGGHPLLEERAVEAVRTCLVPGAALVTPNAPEAARLTGLEVTSLDGQRRAADALLRMGANAVLVKGAHVEGDTFTDLLATTSTEHLFLRTRVPTTSTHGTGCTLASAIAALIAQGMSLDEAVTRAGDYVRAAILAAKGFGQGHGPLHHGWVLDPK